MTGRLDGKVALVTGAARGLGLAFATALVREGARVALADVRFDEAQEAAAMLGPSARAVALDVTDEGAWASAVRSTVEAWGAFHVLVNNAGIAVGAPIEHTTLESYRRVIEVNQVGVFLGMRAAIAPMRDTGGGSIINISSIDGMVGAPRIVSYVASKWAVRGMTKTAAMELASSGIRVNSVHPGHVHTLLASEQVSDLAAVHAMIEEHASRLAPMRRTGEPAEIAALVVFLASDESSYCTGGEFVVDGGHTAGYPSPGSPHPW